MFIRNKSKKVSPLYTLCSSIFVVGIYLREKYLKVIKSNNMASLENGQIYINKDMIMLPNGADVSVWIFYKVNNKMINHDTIWSVFVVSKANQVHPRLHLHLSLSSGEVLSRLPSLSGLCSSLNVFEDRRPVFRRSPDLGLSTFDLILVYIFDRL